MSLTNGKVIVVIVGIVCLSLIELMAIYNNQNGTTLSVVVGGITLIIGYCFGIFKRTIDASADVKEV